MAQIPVLIYARSSQFYTKLRQELNKLMGTECMFNRVIVIQLLPHSRYDSYYLDKDFMSTWNNYIRTSGKLTFLLGGDLLFHQFICFYKLTTFILFVISIQFIFIVLRKLSHRHILNYCVINIQILVNIECFFLQFRLRISIVLLKKKYRPT